MIDKVLYKSLFFLLLQIVLLIVFIPSTWLADVEQQEFDDLAGVVGRDVAVEIYDYGVHLHKKIFVDTGINQQVRFVFVPSDERRANSGGFQDLGKDSWFPWIEGRGDALTKELQIALFRISHLIYWMPVMLLMAIPGIFDGIMVWKKRQFSFETGSVLFQRSIHKMVVLILIIFTLGVFLPFVIPPVILPILTLFLVPLYSIILISSLPKRF